MPQKCSYFFICVEWFVDDVFLLMYMWTCVQASVSQSDQDSLSQSSSGVCSQSSRTSSSLPPADCLPDNPSDAKLCIICCEKTANASIIHSKYAHQVTCYKCARKLQKQKKRCPICRRTIDRVVHQISSWWSFYYHNLCALEWVTKCQYFTNVISRHLKFCLHIVVFNISCFIYFFRLAWTILISMRLPNIRYKSKDSNLTVLCLRKVPKIVDFHDENLSWWWNCFLFA